MNLDEIKNYGLNNNIPIINDDGLDILLTLVDKIKPLRILEVGTAIGYSSIAMALRSSAKIDTIERNSEMYQIALKNVKENSLEDRINVLYCDALDIDISRLSNDYDLIFIDAAKAQYKNFFEKFSPLLKTNGYIFTDNLLFHGLVEKYRSNSLVGVSRNVVALVRKINNYTEWLKNNPKFETTFYDVGDGIAVSKKI